VAQVTTGRLTSGPGGRRVRPDPHAEHPARPERDTGVLRELEDQRVHLRGRRRGDRFEPERPGRGGERHQVAGDDPDGGAVGDPEALRDERPAIDADELDTVTGLAGGVVDRRPGPREQRPRRVVVGVDGVHVLGVAADQDRHAPLALHPGDGHRGAERLDVRLTVGVDAEGARGVVAGAEHERGGPGLHVLEPLLVEGVHGDHVDRRVRAEREVLENW
jgi:hypothetical protein